MTKPFFSRLKDYFSDVGQVLRGEASAASIFPNTVDIGMSREKIYAEILKLHLPSTCNVLFGGFLFDQDGNESNQIDILITNGTSPQFNFHNKNGDGKSFACIDGCVGVVSVKSKLDTTELIDALENIASIPDKQPFETDFLPQKLFIEEYDDWPYKIVFASDGIGFHNLLNSLNEFYRSRPDIPTHKRPNLIHVAGKYVIAKAKKGHRGPDGTLLEADKLYGFLEESDTFGLLTSIIGIYNVAVTSRHLANSYTAILNNIPY